MRHVITATTVALTACGSTAGGPPPAVPPDPDEPGPGDTLVDPGFLERYARTGGFSLGEPDTITVTPDGSAVLFLRSGPETFVRGLIELDVASGQERELATAERLLGGTAEVLSPEERARRERLRLSARGITSYELSRDGTHLLIPLSGRLFFVTRATGEVIELPSAAGYAHDAQLSPDGTKIVCVRDGDLHVIDVGRRSERRLTDSATETVTNGLPEFVAQEEMGRFRGAWWSPDSRTLLYQQTDTSRVETLYSADPLHPERAPSPARYPRAGGVNADVKLGLIPAGGGPTRWVQWDREAFPYVATVRWSEGGPPVVLVQDRRQQVERLLAIDPATGVTELLHEERDDAWLNIDQEMPLFLRSGDGFLFTSERSGEWRLELHDRRGQLVRALTPPGLGYEGLDHLDEESGAVWVRASSEPTETHVYRIPLDPNGGPPVRVSTEPGMHAAFFGEGHDVWVHYAEGLEGGPSFTVRRGTEQRMTTLRSLAVAPPFEPRIELVTVGERQLRTQLVRPRDFEPGRRYPVLVSIYGGPNVRVVRATRRRNLMRQWMADQGFIVVSIDGRGTPGRGREWERAIRGDFITRPLADQVAGLQSLGERFPELDLSRVGIWGWSFGGYFAAMAVMQRADVFHAAVAGAPVADWLDYDTHYTERFLGLPDENREGYRVSSVLTYAPALARPLLIIHGTADDNVYFTHAVKLSDALLRAGRDHELLPLSGFTHMVADPRMTQALQLHIVRFLRDNLP